MMSEFKVVVTKVLTPHASAILLDPEYGLEAAQARSNNAGLLLAYEVSGYDNTRPGRLPDLLPHVSAKRIVDWGADAVKILIYYTPFEDARHQRHQARFHRTHRRGVRDPARFRSSWSSSATIRRAATRRGWNTPKTKPEIVTQEHGGVFQAAIPRRRIEGGSAHQRRIRGRVQRLQGSEGLHQG